MKNIILLISKLPFFFFLVYIFSIFFFKKKKFFKIIIIFNTFFLIIFSLPITSYLLKLPLYPKKNIYEENFDKNYSIILVPTAGFEKHNNEYFAYPSNSSIKRLYDAYNFSKNLEIPIFISGGKTIKNIDSEAEILAKNFFDNLKNMEIILETKSINSYDTGYYVNRYLKENNLEKNIILFTDVYHFKRMIGVLEKNNITVFFLKNSFVKKEIKYYDFLPHYKNYKQMNEIVYSYFGLINYIFLNKMRANALFY